MWNAYMLNLYKVYMYMYLYECVFVYVKEKSWIDRRSIYGQ